MNKPGIENSPVVQMLKLIEEWKTTFSEIMEAIREEVCYRINFKLWLISLEELNATTDIFKKISKENPEREKTEKLESFIKTLPLLKKYLTWEAWIKKIDWEQYLITSKNKVYKVLEQRWTTTCICYNPIEEKYRVYNLKCENDGNDNIYFPNDLESITETDIPGYYVIDTGSKKNNISYYYIWEEWNTQYFWKYNKVSELKTFWDCVYFEWKSAFWDPTLVVHKWDKVCKLPMWDTKEIEPKDWKRLLLITSNLHLENNDLLYSLFSVDEMKLICDRVNRLIFNYSFDENNDLERVKSIEYAIPQPRKWILLGNFFWDKLIPYKVDLKT